MKKILHISKYYAPFVGGIEQVARDCVNSFGAEVEQKVFCFQHEKGDAVDRVDGVEVIRAGCFAKVASQSMSFSYGKLLKKTFREFQPDIVIFHYPNPFGAHFLKKQLKRRPDCKLIVWWHLDITKQKLLGTVRGADEVALEARGEGRGDEPELYRRERVAAIGEGKMRFHSVLRQSRAFAGLRR